MDIVDQLAKLQNDLFEGGENRDAHLIQDARVEIVRLRQALGQAELRYGNLLVKQQLEKTL